jgi:transposase InsO family protein
MKFIDAEKAVHGVSALCRQLRVARSRYYAWQKRPESERAKEDQRLLVKVRRIHRESRERYGSPRAHAKLRDEGEHVSRKRVARLMKEDGLRGRRKRPFRKFTTDSVHGHPIAPNLLNREFTAAKRDQVWVADITSIATGEGWLYLAIVLDLFSRRIVGWALSKRLKSDIAEAALQRAVALRQPAPGLLHHSDRGTQYACAAYQGLLKTHGIVSSMSRKANCLDNAVAESFFSTLKAELVHESSYPSRRSARRAVGEFIDKFYNQVRLHSSLGYVAPSAFELECEAERNVSTRLRQWS